MIFHVETHPDYRDFNQCVTFGVLSNTGAVNLTMSNFRFFRLISRFYSSGHLQSSLHANDVHATSVDNNILLRINLL